MEPTERQPIKIKDNTGKTIKVSNLEKALTFADFNRTAKHQRPDLADYDRERNEYWQHIYEQLLQIKNVQK